MSSMEWVGNQTHPFQMADKQPHNLYTYYVMVMMLPLMENFHCVLYALTEMICESQWEVPYTFVEGNTLPLCSWQPRMRLPG